MPDDRTVVTELATALGMVGCSDFETAVGERPDVLKVDGHVWERLKEILSTGTHRKLAATAFTNGAFFAAHEDGLNGRIPLHIEWSGGRRIPGDQPVPADLSVDHVYMISCKYLSRILYNTAPARIFDDALAPASTSRYPDWYQSVAPHELDVLYRRLLEVLNMRDMPGTYLGFEKVHRTRLRQSMKEHQKEHDIKGLPTDVRAEYRSLIDRVSRSSTLRWRYALEKVTHPELMFWRLLRIYSSTYFILGIDSQRTMRLRVMTPWEWRQSYKLLSFSVFAASKGQPRVDWVADYSHRSSKDHGRVRGHVEIRWSHGPFMGVPEAKVYLDTSHQQVPGYRSLTSGSRSAGDERPSGGGYRELRLLL